MLFVRTQKGSIFTPRLVAAFQILLFSYRFGSFRTEALGFGVPGSQVRVLGSWGLRI